MFGSRVKAVSTIQYRLSSRPVGPMVVWYCGGSDWSSTLECSHVSLKDTFSLNQHAQKVGRIGRCHTQALSESEKCPALESSFLQCHDICPLHIIIHEELAPSLRSLHLAFRQGQSINLTHYGECQLV